MCCFPVFSPIPLRSQETNKPLQLTDETLSQGNFLSASFHCATLSPQVSHLWRERESPRLSLRTSLVTQWKNPPANAGDASSILGFGRSTGEGHSNPLQYSCLENPMDRGAWWATYSSWGFRVGHDQSDLACTHAGMKTNYYLKVQMK